MRTINIEEKSQIESIIEKSKICFLGMSDEDGQPYVLPMNFGYKDGIFYLHCGQEGEKWRILKQNPKVCLTINLGEDLAWQDEHVACSWRMKSETIVVKGSVNIIEAYDEKLEALKILMGQYSDRDFEFREPAVRNVGVFTLTPTTLSAKKFGEKPKMPWRK